MSIIILAIESSCDDTSAAVLIDDNIASNVVSSQLNHRKYGGVVPELASRQHDIRILQVVENALQKAEIGFEDLNAIAFTRGPGLLGSLMVGVCFSKSMALALNIPLIEINHMSAHVLAHFIDSPSPQFPFLCLTVSGGHTQIVKVKAYNDMEILGETIDDAAGEAFDKTGKLLGLDYPSGPIIDRKSRDGNIKFSFPEPKVEGLNFSFSGLKTSILYFLKKRLKEDPDFIIKELDHICASVQFRIVDILINKLSKAIEHTGITEIAVSGGVSANSELRKRVQKLAYERGINCYIPDFQYCTDNAGMIAKAAQFKFREGVFCDQSVSPSPRLKL